jgi:indolepyruvate ferredoxin oxidoreductase
VLGAAVQSGRLAFSTADLEAAFSSTMKATELKNNLLAFALGRMLVADGEKACFEFVGKIEKKQSTLETIEQSIIESFLPWQGKRIFINAFRRNLERVVQYFPTIPIDHLALYLHDLYVYNRGQNVEDFVREAFELKTYFSDEADLARAIRTLAKTYWVKDEIFVAHKMLSPLQAKRNQAWLKLGKSFKVTHINRPSFDIFGRKIEFDLNPSDWMLAIMRHMRWLRPLLPTWHKTERAIATRIRTELLNKVAKMENSRERRLALVALENIKGYRAVREEKARAVFGHL